MTPSSVSTEDTAAAVKPGLAARAVKRARYAGASAMVGAGLALSGGAPAFAAEGDPATSETLVNSGFSSVTSLLTGTIVPALFGITVLIIGVVVGIKWLRKGAKQG